MKTISNLLESKTFLNYMLNRPNRKFLGDVIFPRKKIDSLSFEWVKGANNLPVMAKVQPFGAEAAIMGRDGISTVSGKIPVIKIKRSLDEEEYIKLKSFQKRGYDIPESVIRKIFDDVTAVFDSVENKIEYLRMQALCKGKLDFANDGLVYTVDYLMPTENMPTVATLWSDTTNSDPENDIYTWVSMVIEKGGAQPTKAVTSLKVVNYLLRNVNLRKAIFGVNSDRLLDLRTLNSYFTSKGLPAITHYDLQARQLDGTQVRFFDENKFVLLPGNGLAGDTLVGPTAEALAEDAGKKMKQLKGITVVQWETTEPVSLWTKAAAAQIPSMPYADYTVSATVI
ncbi:major capsid protein [Marinitoga sp. 1155]|uniref:major capsid protein n=1 Tax=Marinitoga sp. 1155 TaxID=1428448 RepID=UPI0006415A42|nr:major capsid protein [Marinitoga sp. 1155]AJW76993.1 major capsid protein [Marinitoga camini virus 2]KLO24747.1 capsid protein [Marinitoga sp. 1155]